MLFDDRLIKKVTDVFENTVIATYVSTLALCFILYQLAKTKDLSALFYVAVGATYLFDVFMYCWPGNEIMHKVRIERSKISGSHVGVFL